MSGRQLQWSADEPSALRSRNLPQLGHAANFHPFDDEDVSFVIKIRAVRRDELAGREMIPRQRPQILVARPRAEVRDELEVFIEQRDARSFHARPVRRAAQRVF